MTAQVFDYNEPLPDLHIHRSRSWEPAARHYQDLTEAERDGVTLTDGRTIKEER